MHLHRQALVIFVFMIVLSGTCAALDMSDIELLDNNFEKLTLISTDNPLNPVLVHLKFTYTLNPNETLSDIRINAEELFPLGIYDGADYSSLEPVCTQTENSYECYINALTLKTSNNVLNLKLTGNLIQEEVTTLYEKNTTINLQVDNTNPIIKFIGTETCNNDVCYIASNKRTKIKIEIQDESASFKKANIAYKISSMKDFVDECEGMNCYGYSKITCEDEAILPLRIVHDGIRSKDDIGNKIQGEATNLTCDSTPPEIKEFSIKSVLGSEVLTLDNQITFELNATDIASPSLELEINSNELLAQTTKVSCTKVSLEQSNFKCSASINPTADAPGQYKVNLTIRDIVGNEVSKEMTLNLLKTSQEAVNLWKITATEQSSKTFSRQNMDYERTLLVKVDLTSNLGAEIVDLKPEGKCYATIPDKTGSDSDVVSVKTMKTQGNTIFLKVGIRENSANRYDSLAKLQFDCPLSIYSKRGNYYYSTSEAENFTILLDFKDEPALGDKLRNEINSVSNKVEKTQNAIKYIDQGLTVATTICNLCASAEKATIATGPLETAADVAADALPPLKPTSKALNIFNVGINQMTKGIPCEETRTVCKYFTCDSELAKGATEWMDTEGTNEIANFAGYSKLSDSMNPYKSYVVALGTGCVPAIVQHYRTLKGIDCSYLSCISQEYVNYGQDLSLCQQEKTMSTCVFFVGGAIDAIPGANLIRDTTSRMGKAIKDPVALFGMAVPLVCKQFKEQSKLHGVCTGFNNGIASLKIIDDIKKFMDVQGLVSSMGDRSTGCATIISAAQADTREWSRVGNNVDAFKFNQSERLSDGRVLTCTTDKCFVEGASNRNDNDGKAVQLNIITNSQTEGKEIVYIYNGNGMQSVYSADKIRERSMELGNEYEKLVYDAYKQYLETVPDDKMGAASEIGFKLQDEINAIKSGESFAIDSSLLNQAPSMKLVLLNSIEYKKIEKELSTLKVESDITTKTIELENNREKAREDIYGPVGRNEAKELEEAEEAYAQALIDATRQKSILDIPLNELSDEQRKDLENLLEANLDDRDITMATSLEIEQQVRHGANREDFVSIDSDKSMGDIMKSTPELAATYKDIKKQGEKELSNKKKEVDKASRNLMTALRAHDQYGTWNKAALTAWGNAARISSLRELTNIDWGMFKEDSTVFNIGEAIEHNVITEGEYKLCQSKIDDNRNVGEGVILNVADETSFSSGAQITARKSAAIENEDGKKMYTYWISLGVSTNVENLRYNVILYDDRGQVTDITSNVSIGNSIISVAAGTPSNFGRTSPIPIESEKVFTKACIKFDVNNLRAYFDMVSSNVNSDKMLCQTFVSE